VFAILSESIGGMRKDLTSGFGGLLLILVMVRQEHPERCAATDAIFDPGPPAVELREARDEGEADPGPRRVT
jgi:hypothetical protein